MIRLFFSVVLVVSKIVLSITDVTFNCTIVAEVDRSACLSLNVKSFTFPTIITAVNIENPEDITVLFFTGKFMQFLPLDIFKFFVNADELEVSTALPQISAIESKTFNDAFNLRSIHIVGQRLHTIGPNTFEGANNIVELFLPSNQIETIHEKAFNNLIKCAFLVLSNNRISSFKPATFKHMTSLWSINIELNYLTTLAPTLFISNNLTVLDLSYNKISSLPEKMIMTFIESSDDQMIFSMIGNVCDDKIYTKKSPNVKKSLDNCFIQNEVTTEVSSKILMKRTEETRDEINDEKVCSKKKCHSIVSAEFEVGKNILEDFSSNIVQWIAEHKMIEIALEKINQHQSEVVPSASCPLTPKPSETFQQLKNEFLNLRKTIEEFGKENLKLSQEIDGLIKIVKEKIPAVRPYEQSLIESTDFEPSTLNENSAENGIDLKDNNEVVEISSNKINEAIEATSELIYIFSQQVSSSDSQCGKLEKIDISSEGSESERETEVCNETVEKLQQQILALKSQRPDNTSYDCSNDRNEDMEADDDVGENFIESESSEEVETLKNLIAKLNNEVIEKDKGIARLIETVKLVRKEAGKIHEEKHENAVEKFELKGNIADCKTMRNVDSIKITSSKLMLTIKIKGDEMDDIFNNLENMVTVMYMRRDDNNFELEDLVDQKVYEILPLRRVNDELNVLKQQVLFRYKVIENNEEKLEEILSEIDAPIHQSRRNRNYHKIMNDKINELEQVLLEQNQLLNNEALKIYDLIKDTKVKLQPLNLMRRDGAESVSDTLDRLQENVKEKDDILREKYLHIDAMVNEMKNSQEDASKAIEDLETVKNEASMIPMFDDSLNNMINSVDNENIQCVDKKIDEQEQTIALQLKQISLLEKENEMQNEKLKKNKKSDKDLRERCESCRGVWSKIKGWFVKKNTCDFIR